MTAFSRTSQALSNHLQDHVWQPLFMSSYVILYPSGLAAKSSGNAFVKCFASTNAWCQWISGLHLYIYSFGWNMLKQGSVSKGFTQVAHRKHSRLKPHQQQGTFQPLWQSWPPSNPDMRAAENCRVRHVSSVRRFSNCDQGWNRLIHWSAHVGNRNRHRRSCPVSPRK